MLRADPTDPRFVAAATRRDGPDLACGLEVSGDAGHTWVPSHPVPKLPRGADKCYAPELAFDRQGRLYYLFIGLHGRGNEPMGVFLTTSTDRAGSFSSPRRLLGAGNYMVRMAIDPDVGEHGRMHLVWLKTADDVPFGGLPPTPNPILASFSDDGGESFSRPIRINDRHRARAVAPALAIGRDHAVHVVYYDLRDDARDYQGLTGPAWPGDWSLVATSSYDGGRHFARGRIVDDRLRPPGRVMLIFTMPPPTLAADRRSGRVFAGWHDARNGDWDVFLGRSTDQGRSWRKPLRVNDDPERSGRDQYLPQLAIAPNGRLDVVFLDRRNDRRNVRNETFYSFLPAGERAMSPNLRLSSATSDSDRGQRYLVPSARGLVEFGARLGLLSETAGATAAWTDTRNASARAYQDIFSGRVAFPSGGAQSSAIMPRSRAAREGSAWVAPALAIVGLALGAAISGRRRRPVRLPQVRHGR